MRIPAGAALLFATATAFAQGFPTKAVTLLVPFAPGGGSDTVARTFQAKLA